MHIAFVIVTAAALNGDQVCTDEVLLDRPDQRRGAWKWDVEALQLCTTIDIAAGIGDAGVRSLARILPQCTRLRTLSLHGNSIGSSGAVALARLLTPVSSHQALPLQTLQKLYLDGNAIGDRGAEALGAALQGDPAPALTVLDLDNNPISDRGVIALARALRTNTVLQSLDLQRMGGKIYTDADTESQDGDGDEEEEVEPIGDAAAIALADALGSNPQSALRILDVNGNSIGNGGARAFVRALRHNTALVSLVLLGNDITDFEADEAIEQKLLQNQQEGVGASADEL